MSDISILSGRTFLFIDDESEYFRLFREMVASQGSRILEASSVDQALEVLAKHADEIAVVISDYSMPEKNGQALLEILLERWPHISRIMSTAIAEVDIARAAINKGQVVAYLNKPWIVGEVLETLRNAVLVHDEYMYNNHIKRLYIELENQDQFRQELIALSSHYILDLTATIGAFHEVIDELEGDEYRSFLATANIANHMIASHVRNTADYLAMRNHNFSMQPTRMARRDLVHGIREYYRGITSIDILFSDDIPDALLLDGERTLRMLTNMINHVMVEISDPITVRVTTVSKGQKIKWDITNKADFSQRLQYANRLLAGNQEKNMEVHGLGGSAFGLLVTKLMAECMGGSAGISNAHLSHLWFTIDFPRV